MNYFDYFKISLSEILKEISEEKVNFIEKIEESFTVEVPSKKNFGELSTNIAMIFSKQLKMAPRDLAELISKESIKKYGPYKGFILTFKRIIKCHPWGGSGYDPIP